MKNIFLITLSLLLIQICDAQTDSISTKNGITSDKNSAIDLPSYLLPSPEVRAITRFGDYPVGYSTGIPDISIPLYEINSGEMKLPIAMKFHPSGRKIEEREGIMGFGWTLDCGGIISRTRRGLTDENNSYMFLPYDSLKADGFIYKDGEEIPNKNYFSDKLLWGVISPEKALSKKINFYDSQYDIFSYVLPSGSGKFILKDTTINFVKSKIPFTIPFKPIEVKITNYQTVFNRNFIGQFVITDIDGTQYYFGKSLLNQNIYTETVRPISIPQISNNDKELNPEYVSAWNITGIISPDKNDTIYFEYGEKKEYISAYNQDSPTNKYNSQTFSIGDKFIKAASELDGFSELDSNTSKESFDELPKGRVTYGALNYSTCRISQISFKKNTIKFNVDPTEKLLNSIEVINYKNDLIKRCNFYYSKYNGEIVKTMDYFTVSTSNQTNTTEKYSFDYYRATAVYDNFYAKDWWGYYNNMNNNFVVPNFNIKYLNYNGTYKNLLIANNCFYLGGLSVDRSVNENAVKTGMLKKIVYPTGGSTEFIYEMNKYKSAANSGLLLNGPGLRIVSIINSPLKGESVVKSYGYENEEFPEQLKPNEENFVEETRVRSYLELSTNYSLSYYTIYIEQNPDESYKFVQAYFDYSRDFIGTQQLNYMDYRVRTYNSDFVLETTGLCSSNVHYRKVTETFSSAINNTGNGYIIYIFDPLYRDFAEYKYYDNEVGNFVSKYDDYKIQNKLKYIKDDYCWKGGKLRIKEDHSPNKITKTTYYDYNDFIVDKRNELCAKRYFNFIDNTEDEFLLININESSFGNKLFCYALKNYISGVELLTKETTVVDNVTSIKEYIYEPKFLQLSKEIVWDSKATFDFYNRIATGSNNVTEYKYPYQISGNAVCDSLTKRNILTPVIEKTNYKNNNQFLDKTITDYYPWSKYLIAPQSIQYQSSTQTSPEIRLVFSSYDKNGNPVFITKDNTNSVVYLWSYKGLYPIAEIKNATYTEVAGAVQKVFSMNIDNLSAMTVPNESKLKDGSLQNALSNALVTTYTYKPLVGITSVTDPRGVTTTYNYDDFNRLQSVVNTKNQTTQSFDYNYKQ